MKNLDRSVFLKELKKTFPELRCDLNQEYGILTLEMSVFREFVQKQIDSENKENLIKCYQIIEKYLNKGNGNILNSIGVSLLEHLNFNDGKSSREWAESLMPKSTRLTYDAVKNYHDN